eukprot:SAG11_NODE_3255_length_2576_cov_1.721437_1_plen_85_part_10
MLQSALSVFMRLCWQTLRRHWPAIKMALALYVEQAVSGKDGDYSPVEVGRLQDEEASALEVCAAPIKRVKIFQNKDGSWSDTMTD